MDVAFKQERLERLYLGPADLDFSPIVVAAYIERLAIIRAAPDESVFENLKFLRYRKLPGKGKRRAMRLVGKTDLLLRIQGRQSPLTALVEAIRKRGRSAA